PIILSQPYTLSPSTLLHHTIILIFFFERYGHQRDLHSFPTRRSSDLEKMENYGAKLLPHVSERLRRSIRLRPEHNTLWWVAKNRSEEHTSELQSRENLVCRLLLEKKKTL